VHIHKNARLTPIVREELVRRIVNGHARLSVAASEFNISTRTAAKWVRRFEQVGSDGLLDRSSRPHHSPRCLSPERTDDECKAILVTLLHRPPSEHGINRTTWRLVDLHRIGAEQGLPISRARMHRMLKSTGYRWRKARTVLTSQDPEYAQKVKAIKEISVGLKDDDLAERARAGRVLRSQQLQGSYVLLSCVCPQPTSGVRLTICHGSGVEIILGTKD
jgi:transposase